jgi:predicted MFS family arabinose efflux permease
VRRGRPLRVPLHGHADPARRLDRRARASARDLLNAARATFSGLCAILVGIGLARFAYTPLLPALIAGGWFAPASAAYLGAANLAGYTAGALLASSLAARFGPVSILRAMMLLATAAFFACSVPLAFAWFFVWRLASGVAGGVLMVLAAPTVLPHVPAARRGLAGGAIFTGVGLGIAASGTVVPLLLRWGLTPAWCGLGVLALVLSALAWTGWPRVAGSSVGGRLERPPRLRSSVGLKAIYVEYGLNAIGLVPHMVFLVDFVARGLGRGLDVGGRYWVLFGVGAMLGPVLAGRAADRIGFRWALRWALGIQMVAVAVLAVWTSTGWLVVSSLLIGAFVPGVVGRVQELASPETRTAAWGHATTAFAVGLTAAGYGFSFVYSRTESYATLFALGGAIIALALVIDLAVRPPAGVGPPTAAPAPAPPRPAAR